MLLVTTRADVVEGPLLTVMSVPAHENTIARHAQASRQHSCWRPVGQRRRVDRHEVQVSSDRHKNQGGLRELSTTVVGGWAEATAFVPLLLQCWATGPVVKPHIRILPRRKKRSFQQRGIRLANPPPRRDRLDLRRKKLSGAAAVHALGLARSVVYRRTRPSDEDDTAAMHRIDALYTEHPFYS